ncbi:MAG: ankyrin repeat domain-containing protein [Planctomycetaceae bacterium]
MIGNLVSITILARWTGFARPSQKCNRLTIQRSSGDGYAAFDEMNQIFYPVESHWIKGLLDAIRLECPSIRPTLFGRSQDELDFHFEGWTTDDYPAMKLRMELANNKFIEMSTNSNHAHLLPWTICDPNERTSFNPQISIRLANLMPDGFLFRERLTDSSNSFESDKLFRDEIARMDNEKTFERPEKCFESQGNRHHEQLQHFADAAKNGDFVNYDSSQPQYTANQLRQLSEQQLSELVLNGFDLSTSDETGQTALMLTAFPPFNSNQFRKLVQAGADVNAKRSDGLTGLMLACAGGEELSVKEWLHAGASVDFRGPNNSTALMLGAKNGVIVSDLLAHGAKATDLDDDGETALDYAMDDISIMWAGKRLRSIELLSAALETVDAHSLVRSHNRAMELTRKLRLEIDIEREFGGRTMSKTIQELRTKQSQSQDQGHYLNDILKFVDLEITEIELADRIVEILGAAVFRRP